MNDKCQVNLVTPLDSGNKFYGLQFKKKSTNQSKNALVFMHGAGLDYTSPLYINIANQIVDVADVFLPGLTCSSFLNYNQGFRNPLGWSYHKCQEAISDYRLWLDWIMELDYESIILGGHSWGALLTLAGTYTDLNMLPVILLSPLPEMQSIIKVNYRDERLAEIMNTTPDELSILLVDKENTPFKFLSLGTIHSLLNFPLKLDDYMSLWSGSVLTIVGQKENTILLSEIKEVTAKLNSQNAFIEIPKEGHFYSRGHTKVANAIKDFINSLE